MLISVSVYTVSPRADDAGRFFLLLPFLLSSMVAPFATAPDSAKEGVVDAGPRVAVCYNPSNTPDEKIQELAQAECLGEVPPSASAPTIGWTRAPF